MLEKPTLILGADVTHPAPTEKTRPSIAAVCASLNASFTVYKAEVSVQAHREEIIKDLRDMVR